MLIVYRVLFPVPSLGAVPGDRISYEPAIGRVVLSRVIAGGLDAIQDAAVQDCLLPLQPPAHEQRLPIGNATSALAERVLSQLSVTKQGGAA